MKPPLFEFIIPGDPVPKLRARVTRGGMHTFTPTKTLNYEEAVKFYFRQYATDKLNVAWEPLEGPLALRIEAFFTMPKTLRKKHDALLREHTRLILKDDKKGDWIEGKIRSIEQEAGLLRFKTTKPDWDNLGKCISDALNGLAWRDDSQVVDVRVTKQYALDGVQARAVVQFYRL